jgi:VWFA-related protein
MSRTKTVTSLTLLLPLLLAGSAGPQEQGAQKEPTLTFPTGIEQVTVDVVVMDKKGEPVTDLTRKDVEVYEDGVRQEVASFDKFEVAPPPAAPASAAATPAPTSAPPRLSTNTSEKEERGRTFVLVFDDVHLTPYTAQQSRTAIGEFLRTETTEGDKVTLVVPGTGVWWTTRMEAGRSDLLGILKKQEGRDIPETRRDRITDYEAMRIHVFRDNMIIDRVQRRFENAALPTLTQQSPHVRDLMATEDPYVTSRAAEVYYTATARNRITLKAIERALNGLVSVKGRKSLVIVSDGFIYDPHLDAFRRIVDASRHANTAIYFVNSLGLEGLPVGMDAETSTIVPEEDLGFAFSEDYERAEGSESLAADTGGFTVRNSNDLAGSLKRIADETRAYYLIGYNPTNAARDGTFRKIEVKVPGRKGVEIRARRGYYAPSDQQVADTSKAGVDPVFQGALDSPYDMDGVPLRMTHFVREETLFGKARVYLATEVDIRGLHLAEEDGREVGTLQFLLVAMQRDTGEYFRYDQKVDLKLLPETRARLARTWLPIVRDFELSPGRYRAKIVVQDKTTGRLGTVSHDFEVPDLAGFRVSTPVVSDLRETSPDGTAARRLALLARRDFAPEGSLFCQLDVYRAVKLEDSGLPRVSFGYEVRRSDGSLYTGEAPRLIAPTEQGAVSTLIGFSLDGAAPGNYTLVMRVKDELSGKTLNLREPFHVDETPPRRASTAP